MHPVKDNYMALGSFYVVVTKQFCEHLFENPKMIELLAYMPGVKIPDELYFATAVSSSNEFRCTHVNSNFRFTAWGRSNLFDKVRCSLEKEILDKRGTRYLTGGSHPCILGMDEINNEAKVTTPLAFFANKFDMELEGSEAALDSIDKEVDEYEEKIKNRRNLLREEESEIKEMMQWVERGWPHPLHCPNYQGAGH